jgi:hypothetical protein
VRAAALGLALLLAGCPRQTPLPVVDPAVAHVGAWYGSGPGFPEERLCLIFCPNGLLFAGETACDALEAPDFRLPYAVSRVGEQVEARQMAAPTRPPFSFRFAVQADGSALADIGEQKNLPFDRVASLSPLCLGTGPAGG